MILGAAKKVGKSFMALNLARTLTVGGLLYEIPGFYCTEPATVGMVEAEVGPWSLYDRALNVFAGEDDALDRLHIISGQRGFRVDVEGAVEQMVRWVKERALNVLILDPIGKMHGLDENNSQEVERLMHKLDRVLDACTDTDLSIVLSHHFGKPPRDPRVDYDPLNPDNIVGSYKWTADPDTLVTAARRNIEGFPNKWRIDTRWVFRHAEPVEDQTLVFNAKGNMRVEREERSGGFEPVLV